MANNDESNGLIFTGEFGRATLEQPFAQQDSLRKFLDIPVSEGERLVSDAFLTRLLTIAKSAIEQELTTSDPKETLASLYVGYEVWKALPPGADHRDRKPEDLEASYWVDLEQKSITEVVEPTAEVMGNTELGMAPNVAQLIRLCQEEVLRWIDPKFLAGKSFYILTYGTTESSAAMFSPAAPKIFGARRCGCYKDRNNNCVGTFDDGSGFCNSPCRPSSC